MLNLAGEHSTFYYCISPSLLIEDRSSRPEGFCKKGVLRNFVKFTGKHLCQSLFLNKVAESLKKEALAQVFPVNFVFVKILRTFLRDYVIYSF